MPRFTGLADVVWERARRIGLACLLASAAACSSDLAPPPDDAIESPPAMPTPRSEPGPEADRSIVVGHDRELRGAWISTVYNGTWPSRTGLTKEASQAELLAIFDALAAANMNAVFLQVRPESDAIYESALEPWSRFLTGEQGKSPAWDPLTFAVSEGHRRGLEVHAWINPYRGLVSATSQVAETHPSKTLASATVRYGNQIWMDPGSPDVRAHILEVIEDILKRYDIDGIHFDDYFYPYPVSGQTFRDADTYEAYLEAGGKLSLSDFRRHNVDTMVREAGELVAKTRADVRFGISPFGIYRPGIPEGIAGLDAYATLYCDPVRWMKEGWVDYLAPQLYWPTTKAPQAFGKLVAWWAGLAGGGRSIFVGHDATKVGEDAWPLDEYDAQMNLARAERARGVRGSIFFSAKPLVSDERGLRSSLVATHWARKALTPPLASAVSTHAVVDTPKVDIAARKLMVHAPTSTRAVALYRVVGGVPTIERLVPAAVPTTEIQLADGSWVVSVIDRRGIESRGVPVEAR